MKDKSDVRTLREDHESEHIPKSVERFAKLAQNAVCEAGSYFVQQLPMFCWPQLADQPEWVGRFGRLGVDMKDKCVKKMVRALMEDQREEILGSVSVKVGLRGKTWRHF
ncbi:hypothetical protein ACE6H2_021628 [Prunus campanulata]